jgi:hypothetical protein
MTMRRQWTFMVYMAGDNGKVFEDSSSLMADLQSFGWQNLADMAKAGSTDQVAIVAQYDTLDNQVYTPRLYLDGSSSTGVLVEKIPPVNTGEPKNLTDFIVWAERNYPANQYALILWNHGTGWKEDDIYARYRENIDMRIVSSELRSGYGKDHLLKKAMFLSTVGEIMSVEDEEIRGICYDDSSMSFLDNKDLEKALVEAQNITGQRLSLIGMDACLMSMVEVAYQLRDMADVMVASQEVELAYGWPYFQILQELVKQPDMSPELLGKIIVREFGTFYLGMGRDGGGISTLSAIRLAGMDDLFFRLREISSLILQKHDQFQVELALQRARIRAQDFSDADYIDLKDFIEIISVETVDMPDIQDVTLNLLQNLQSDENEKIIIENFRGSHRPKAYGISVYFPFKRYSPFYDAQDFSASGWNEVIRLYNKKM